MSKRKTKNKSKTKRARKHTAKAAKCLESTPEIPKASFFGIPGELRNRIYRFALLETHLITLSNTTAESPGITRTNRQAREESLSIFLLENHFNVKVINLKPALPPGRIHWTSKVPSVALSYSGVYNWDNLKQGIHDVWHKGGKGEGGRDPKRFATRVAFEIMYEMRNAGVQWTHVDGALEVYKRGIETVDKDFWNGRRLVI